MAAQETTRLSKLLSLSRLTSACGLEEDLRRDLEVKAVAVCSLYEVLIKWSTQAGLYLIICNWKNNILKRVELVSNRLLHAGDEWNKPRRNVVWSYEWREFIVKKTIDPPLHICYVCPQHSCTYITHISC